MILLIVNQIAEIVLGIQSKLTLPNLDTWVSVASATETISLRELTRLAFLETGVEVEFSGKGAHEKGVVIDMDIDRMKVLGLNPDILKFGQTVIKVNVLQEKGEWITLNAEETSKPIEMWLADAVQSALNLLR
ncbi:hypothetical protein HH214_07235 [Mucilaginibacter robiniae]|uniref:Uncharacterized protein n=1 Tax=Mucilaginibacter robiniae TaxID=2728022 RepID=A0A7L5E5P6_9SPHI|nr:hypothetical protein [Mucilaginibacter robiniae]QJD95676.1 hypothetical protein HH214_07235 [Mucilaginibacter robiniae]